MNAELGHILVYDRLSTPKGIRTVGRKQINAIGKLFMTHIPWVEFQRFY
jgi:hypothetical protein